MVGAAVMWLTAATGLLPMAFSTADTRLGPWITPWWVSLAGLIILATVLAYVSGHGPLRTDGTMITGQVGAELTLPEGKAAARQVGLAILATLRKHLGSLDRVKRVIKLLGMVNSAPAFYEHPKVINGFSDLMVEVFGEAIGKHARSAVGMAGLPGGIPVEIEVILEVE